MDTRPNVNEINQLTRQLPFLTTTLQRNHVLDRIRELESRLATYPTTSNYRFAGRIQRNNLSHIAIPLIPVPTTYTIRFNLIERY